MSDFVNDVEFVPISYDGEFHPGGSVVRYYRGFYYIIDDDSQQIFKIGEDGAVVRKIGCQGRASNEYLKIDAFDVNPSTSEVYVYDGVSPATEI